MSATPRDRILIVEDEAAVAEVLRRRLVSLGFEVHTEATAQRALGYVAEHELDLVILDLRLPDRSGLQVCQELRKRFNRWDLPVLMLTGMDQPIDQLRGFACGADAYLTKPYEPRELIKTIALLLGEAAKALPSF